MNRGTLIALSAYIAWGLLPIYWKTIEQVPPQEILSHRVVWSFVVVSGLLALQRNEGLLRRVAARPALAVPLVGSAALLAVNWFTYLWANNNGHIVETSLGYFINPLVNVLLGVVFLRERVRGWQGVAIGLAFAGVAYLTISHGSLPWIALTLALSFGFYGLIRKTTTLGSVEGFTVEMSVMFVPALAFLVYRALIGQAAFGQPDARLNLLLAFAGVATAIPLVVFAYAARQVTLTTLGLVQYIAPTLQFLIGVLVYGESFTRSWIVGFSLIWAALLLYAIEGLIVRRKQAPAAAGS